MPPRLCPSRTYGAASKAPLRRVVLVALALVSLAVARPVFAAGLPDGHTGPAGATSPAATALIIFGSAFSPAVVVVMTNEAASPAPFSLPAQTATRHVAAGAPARVSAARPRGLTPLFASYAVLQALDAHSTLTAFNNGATERNPMLAPFASRPAAFVGLKAAMTAGAIVAADRLSRHNRAAAYVVMVALNSAYVMVVLHNYRVAGGR